MKLPPNDTSLLEYEMGYSADEFGDVLTKSFDGADSGYACLLVTQHHWQIQQLNSGFRVHVQIKQKSPRKLGLLNLPILQVNFRLVQSDSIMQAVFFKRFFQYFHKGGG